MVKKEGERDEHRWILIQLSPRLAKSSPAATMLPGPFNCFTSPAALALLLGPYGVAATIYKIGMLVYDYRWLQANEWINAEYLYSWYSWMGSFLRRGEPTIDSVGGGTSPTPWAVSGVNKSQQHTSSKKYPLKSNAKHGGDTLSSLALRSTGKMDTHSCLAPKHWSPKHW